MKVFLANKIGLVQFVEGLENRVKQIELFAECAQCRCMKILALIKSFYVNNLTPSI